MIDGLPQFYGPLELFEMFKCFGRILRISYQQNCNHESSQSESEKNAKPVFASLIRFEKLENAEKASKIDKNPSKKEVCREL